MSAKINDMYYAYSAIEDIKEKGEYGGVVTTIMKYLLEFNLKLFDCILLSFCLNNPIYVYQKAKEERGRVENQ